MSTIAKSESIMPPIGSWRTSRPGLIAGLFFGFAFGMGGLGAAALGVLADKTSIEFVYKVCSFLPMIGLLTLFLPNIEHPKPVKVSQIAEISK